MIVRHHFMQTLRREQLYRLNMQHRKSSWHPPPALKAVVYPSRVLIKTVNAVSRRWSGGLTLSLTQLSWHLFHDVTLTSAVASQVTDRAVPTWSVRCWATFRRPCARRRPMHVRHKKLVVNSEMEKGLLDSARRVLTDVNWTSHRFFSWPSVSFTHLKFRTALHVRKLLNCRGEFLSLTPSRLGFSNQYGPQSAAARDVRHAKQRVLFAEQRRYIKEQQVHACVELLAAHLLPVWPCRFHPPPSSSITRRNQL